MANNMRKRYDFSANPAMILEFACDIATVIEIGDLCWYDGDDAKPFSATGIWTGNANGSLAKAAEKFLGLSMSAHPAQSLITPPSVVRIAGRGVFALPLNTATTLEIGDLVGPVKDPGGNYLYTQVVAKVTDVTQAIGKVMKRGTLLTVAHFEIVSSVMAGGGTRTYLTS